MFRSGGDITPPPPPPPAGNPPTYASSQRTTPMSSTPAIYQGIGSTILTSPEGAPDQGAVKRKSLLGQ